MARHIYRSSHINYAMAAISEHYGNPHEIPKAKIILDVNLRLRHFQSGVQSIYPK